MTPRLSAYLGLEREMLALDAAGDPLVEVLRDSMDSVWYRLSEEERELLDERTLHFSGPGLPAYAFCDPVEPPVTSLRESPISVHDWECAA